MNDDMRNDSSGELVETKTKGRVWPIAAPIVLVLLGVMLVFTVGAGLLGDDEEDGTAAQAPATTGPAGDADPSDPNASLCGLAHSEASGTLATAPADTEWTRVGATNIPTSRSAGPGVIEASQVRYCYAHTPEGAVLAAANVAAWAVAATQDARGVIERGVASGPGFDAAIANLRTDSGESGESTGSTQIVGFQLVTYTESDAIVSLALLSQANNVYAQLQVELIWEANDWRVRFDASGEIADATVIPDLTGYVSWSAA